MIEDFAEKYLNTLYDFPPVLELLTPVLLVLSALLLPIIILILLLSKSKFGLARISEEVEAKYVKQFLSWVQEKDSEYYESLSPELKISILDALLINFSKHDSEYAMVVTRLFFVFWNETGEKDRALALRPALNDALSNSDDVNKKEVLRALKLSKRYLRVKRFRQLVRGIQKNLYQPLFSRNKFSQS